MATRYRSEGSTAYGTGWDTLPVSNDTGVIGRGSDQIVSGLDQSGVDHLALRLTPYFTGTIGAPGSSLNTDVNQTATGIFEVAWGGRYLYVGNSGRTINRTIMNAAGGGTLYATAGTWTTVEVSAGTFDASDQVVSTTLYVFGGEVEFDDNATGITTIYMVDGTLRLKRGATTINQRGGTIIKYDNTRAVTTWNLYGGTADYRNGALTTLNAYGGDFLLGNAERDFTITTINASSAANLQLMSRGTKVTITNAIAQLGGGSSGIPHP